MEESQLFTSTKLVSIFERKSSKVEFSVANVIVPNSDIDQVKKVFQQSINSSSKKYTERVNLVSAIEKINLGSLTSLFPESEELPNTRSKFWWEIWVRKNSHNAFISAVNGLNMTLSADHLEFVNRDVFLVQTTKFELEQLIKSSDSITEVRLYSGVSSFFLNKTPIQQKEWVDNLKSRIVKPKLSKTSICILDTGVDRNHPLISDFLNPSNHLSYNKKWNSEDFHGHGTGMAGLALFGDLNKALVRTEEIKINYELESVKILPNIGENDPKLYGDIMKRAVILAEKKGAKRNRIFCLAVTEDNDDKNGRPSAWSAMIDTLAFNQGINSRLFFICAGNIRESLSKEDYLIKNDNSCIFGPAQAWNALTVGAMTEYGTIVEEGYEDWQILGQVGNLSPTSRTSVLFDGRFPFKPDVVFEGGNFGINPQNQMNSVVDLELLTTNFPLQEALLMNFGETSAAVALASRMGLKFLLNFQKFGQKH